MKKEFDDVYHLLFMDYIHETGRRSREIRRYRESEMLRLIRNQIVQSDSVGTLRSDAKYFLLVNFHCMVLLPLIREFEEFNAIGYKVSEFENSIHEIDIKEAIISDINEIIYQAQKMDNSEKVSGHQIMRVIDDLWTKLKTTQIQIWGE
jgi:hypothetical protein